MPDRVNPCPNCGALPEATYHPDGSYRSFWHRCSNPPPGPPDPPRAFPAGKYYPDDPHEREVGALKGKILQMEGERRWLFKRVLEALGLKDDAQRLAAQLMGDDDA